MEKGLLPKSIHIIGSKHIFSLYSTAEHVVRFPTQFLTIQDVGFYSQFGSLMSLVEMDTNEAEGKLSSIYSEIVRLVL